MPAWREGPPYAMTEMIAAEPALAERLIARLSADPRLTPLVTALMASARSGDPILVTGCGTSEHAAMVVATLLDDAIGGISVRSAQALELARHAPSRGIVLGVSHEGGTWATNLALEAAGSAGARTALITVSDRSPGALGVEVLLTTLEQDQSWCHTVGYLSPILAAAVIAGAIAGMPFDGAAARALLDRAAADATDTAEAVARRLAGCSRLLIVGSGIDFPAARELALKVEEGARLPATALQLETIRHGHLAAADEQTGLVLVLTDAEGWGALPQDRAMAVLRSAQALGMTAAAIVSERLLDQVPSELTPAGRISVPTAPAISTLAASAIGSAIPLQLLAERLARARGTNPDTIGRENPRQAAAADA